ncbi:uncharacterized protein H6S33_009716 [Morchella sextelata]|uniref:uncharacterized protein n=1 Tax=Morchella sextelata TaxID=1174677 RepID=UPI001D04F443|nr:uncharacterized protein H6S33_009716 [Morchella sextelata]KAH0613336.1 hypothetical protein H6S33_009716 [Morchella sextelata]
MHFSTFLQVLGFLGLMSSTNAHHMLTNIIIGGVDQGDGNSMLRKAVSIDAGRSVTLQWRTWPDGSQNAPIADSHQGPCAVYMKSVNSFTDQAPANGPGWFKIWHDGFRDGVFCTERLRASGGKMTVTIPKDLAGGLYLIRAEHLALHQAQNIGGAQWYIGCVQARVYSTGGNARPQGVSIPGHTDANHPGVHFDYWNNMKPTSYSIPGPAPYVVTNAGGGSRIPQAFQQQNPACRVSNADWCSADLPEYKDEGSCWESCGNCWKQVNDCYNTAPPTGHKGCTQFENYCTKAQEQCRQCGSGTACHGSFPPAKRSLSLSSDGEGTPQNRNVNKHTRRTTAPVASSAPEAKPMSKETMGIEICVLTQKNCNNHNDLLFCGRFAHACVHAVEKYAEQFPVKAERKWQGLWMFQTVCDNEDLSKDACRDKYSKAMEGFE